MKTTRVYVGILLINVLACAAHAGIPAAKMERTENTIRRHYPTVTYETLATDKLAVDAAFRSTQFRLTQKGFSEKEITDIVLTIWLNKRKDSATNLSETVLVNEVKKHGLLIVESNPSGASVTIDQESARNTQCEKWVLSGTHHIIIRKDGYIPEEGHQMVTPETRVVFKRELRPVVAPNAVTPR